MQAQGIAEADPSLDVDGWDAAAKAAVLANVWLDARITPHDVVRAGHSRPRRRRPCARRPRPGSGSGSCRRGAATGSRSRCDARPVALSDDDPLAAVSGLENALYLTTDLLGEVGIVQRDGGLTQTAYGLLADLSRVARRLSA